MEVLISFIIPFIIVIFVLILGGHWGNKWLKSEKISKEELYDIGYIGCFFRKIFGWLWGEKY